MHTLRLSLAVGLAVLLVPVASSAQDSGEEASDTVALEEMIVLGTRVRGVSQEDLAVPVDVYEVEEIATVGTADLGVALQKTAPSFNSKRNALGDGGLFHTATLRGMSPDHTLLLINGKRRHSISFPRPLDTAGLGTTGLTCEPFQLPPLIELRCCVMEPLPNMAPMPSAVSSTSS